MDEIEKIIILTVANLNECNYLTRINDIRPKYYLSYDILTLICSKSPVSKDVGVCSSQQLSLSSCVVTGATRFQVTTLPLFVPAAKIPKAAKKIRKSISLEYNLQL